MNVMFISFDGRKMCGKTLYFSCYINLLYKYYDRILIEYRGKRTVKYRSVGVSCNLLIRKIK